MTAPARFRQADVQRAAAGVARAGFTIAKIEIDRTGKISIIPGQPESQARGDEWADLEPTAYCQGSPAPLQTGMGGSASGSAGKAGKRSMSTARPVRQSSRKPI